MIGESARATACAPFVCTKVRRRLPTPRGRCGEVGQFQGDRIRLPQAGSDPQPADAAASGFSTRYQPLFKNLEQLRPQ